jgi:uncharacterized membrane protein YbhN (UPF0104 family)
LKFQKKHFLYVTFIAIVLLWGYYCYNNINEIKKIFELNIFVVFIIGLIIFINTVVGALPNKLILSKYGLKLKFYEWYGIFVVTTLGNFLPMRAGLVFKAAYLKKRHSFTLGNFGSLMGLTYAIIYIDKCLIGFVVSVGILASNAVEISVILPITFLIIAISFIVLISYDYSKHNVRNKYLTKVKSMFEGMKLQPSDIKPVAILIVAINIATILDAVKYLLIFKHYSVDIGFWGCILLSISISLSTLVSITPSNLGIRELITGIAFVGLGGDLNEGLVISIIDRVLHTIIILGLGSSFGLKLLKISKSELN